MAHLEVPGAALYYESKGSGPLFLCISGGNGNAEPWRPLAEALKEQYTVVCYDRRGFSRSALTDTQDYTKRLAVDADDAAALIRHLSPNGGPATVVGSSSGAIVAIELLTRHPDLLSLVFAHEPPLIHYLPDFEAMWAKQQRVYDAYRTGGLVAGAMEFAQLVEMGGDRASVVAMLRNPANPYQAGNMTYWYEREVMHYPKREWPQHELESVKGKLVFLLGLDSPSTALQCQGPVELAKLLDSKTESVSGHHFGYMTHSTAFADEVRDIVARRQ